MMKSILVPTDFSYAAKNAANYAIDLAKAFNSRVILFHVYTIPVPVSTGAPIQLISSDELQVINENYLKEETDRLNKKSGIQVTYLSKMGPVVHEILEAEKNADLVIMGMKGSSMLSEAILGSTTTATMRKSTKPLLVIPENVQFKAPEIIVFASDYKPVKKTKTLEGLDYFIMKFHSHLYILNISQKNDVDNLDEEIKNTLKQEIAGNQPIYYFVEHDDPVSGINEFVKQKKQICW